MSGTDYEDIELLVRNRRSEKARRAISVFLSRSGDSNSIFLACDWYRRLGLHEVGLRLVQPEKFTTGFVLTSSFEGRRAIWCARFLNLLGATEFAESFLKRVKLVGSEDFRIAGSIALAGFQFEKGRKYLESLFRMKPDMKRYDIRLAMINLADTLSGIGDHRGAIQCADRVLALSRENLLIGIALQAKGEFLVKLGRIREASLTLARAKVHFPTEDRSPDFGILLKWEGYCQGLLGNLDFARRNFSQAFTILRGASLRPEAWLDVRRLAAKLRLLNRSELAELRSYPGLCAPFRTFVAEVAPAQRDRKSKRTEIAIDLRSEEYEYRGRRVLGLPLVLRAVSYVVLSGHYGIPLVCLKSLLWPDEAHAYLQLEGRLQQLLWRLRKEFGFDVSVTDGVVSLSKKQRMKIRVSADSPFPTFLRRISVFSRRDLQDAYGMSRTQALNVLRKWRKIGWIHPVSDAGMERYRVVSNSLASKQPVLFS